MKWHCFDVAVVPPSASRCQCYVTEQPCFQKFFKAHYLTASRSWLHHSRHLAAITSALLRKGNMFLWVHGLLRLWLWLTSDHMQFTGSQMCCFCPPPQWSCAAVWSIMPSRRGSYRRAGQWPRYDFFFFFLFKPSWFCTYLINRCSWI